MAVYSPSFQPTGYFDFNGEIRPFATPRNVLEVAVPDINKTSTMNMVGRAIITPLEGLKITGEFSYTNINTDLASFDKVFTQFIDGTAYIPLASGQTNSNYSNTVNSTNNKAVNIYANYNKKIDSHNLGLVVGTNMEKNMYKSLFASRLDMINQELPSLGQATGTTTANDNFIESSLFGVFYRANYSYKEKYLLEASGRYDGSSKFPGSNRFGLFPSFSAGWRISEESIMKNLNKVISNLKLRASYGSIGNQNIAAYNYLPTMSASLVNWVVNGLKSTTLGTPTLVRSNFTWEEVRTINAGLDMSAFNSRFSSTFDIFNRQTIGMLGPGADYPAVLGAPAPLQNSANMETKGWELEMAWHDKIGKWKYGFGFNLSDNVSTILKYKNDTKILSAAYYEGMTLGEIWGYETDRLYTADDFVAGTLKTTPQGLLSGGTLLPGIAKVKGAAPNPGDVLFKNPDANGDIWASSNTVNDPGSKRIIGNNSYRYVFGINADVSYKGLSLAILLTGVGKRDVWMKNASIFPLNEDFYYSLFEYQTDYWTPEHTDAFFARPYNQAKYSTANNLLPQTRYLQNASYIDIKSVVLSYEIPTSLVSKIKLKKANLFINGENLFSFNHYPTGLHPDTRDRVQGSQYPVMRMFTFGATISF
jgi:TonB-linked SusC/RagA family outer membrane protein